MDEENISRPLAHPVQSARPTPTLGIPEQRASTAPQPPATDAAVPRVMNIARVTLTVIFAMLLFGAVLSYILTRA